MKQFFQKNFIWISGVLLTCLVFLDQWTKSLAVQHLKGQAPFVLLEDIFEFYYFENTGAAWGILKGKQGFFYFLTIVFLAVILMEMNRLRKNIRFLPMNFTLLFMIAGAIGNFIDRVTQQYVVDFIYFKLINFPIFNVADCYITVSVPIAAILMIWYYSDDEFDFILPFMTGKKEKDE